MGTWVGAIQWIADVNHIRVRSIGFNKVKVNGEVITIANGGKKMLEGGAWVQMSGNKVTIGVRGEEVDLVAYGYFFNLYARSNVSLRKIHGICAHQMLHSHEFTNPQPAHRIIIHHKPCPKREEYEDICKRRGIKGGALKNCIFDLCAGTSKKTVLKIQKETKKEKKNSN